MSMEAPFEALGSQIESAWRDLLGGPQGSLQLYALPKEFQYLDSLDSELEHQSWTGSDLPDPEPNESGYPRLLLENRRYASEVFRCLHLELAARQDGLQVLHCVMYPRPEYDVPICSMDLVGFNSRITLAIMDLAPVSLDHALPPAFAEVARQLQERYGMASNRAVPAWGQAIFSRLCVSLRPEGPDDILRFLKYAIALTRAYLLISKQTSPVGMNREARLNEIKDAQQRYCQKMLENDKTRRVLAVAWGDEFAERYMKEVMFDLA